MELKQIIDRVLKLDPQKRVKFIVLFGSVSRNKATPLSDIDLAVFYEGNGKERFKFRALASGTLPDTVDLHIFQDLPLAVKKEVINGKVLYYRDFQFVFDRFLEVIKEFDYFEKYYRESLQEMARRAET